MEHARPVVVLFTGIMYGGEPHIKSVNAIRAKILRKMAGDSKNLDAQFKVYLERFPSPKVSLIHHIQWVYHRLAGYRRAQEAITEGP